MIVHADIIAAEIGSTTTMVSAFTGINTKAPALIGQGMARTTAALGDVRTGLQNAIDDMAARLCVKRVDGQMTVACSSAAGGLRMTVHGLVPEMTARAAKEAALGAGAVVKLVTCGKLTETQLQTIREIDPSIILLAGGVDYGERGTAVFNGERLRSLLLKAPVVYCGNVECRSEIETIFRGSGQKLYLADNVYPRIDLLNVESAGRAIQEVFAEHIVKAPGMDGVREIVTGGIMPTPGAVMEAAKLLYHGIGEQDLVVFDIGGATTDVHSVGEGSPENAGISVNPEPLAKRTVEGDLGVFINAGNILDMIGRDTADTALGFDALKILQGYSGVPETDEQRGLALFLAEHALVTAVMRHAGRRRHIYGPSGRATVVEGKDLTAVKYAVGTGGALTRLPGGAGILSKALNTKNTAGTALLPKPENVTPLLDKDYIMAQTGILGRINKESALLLLLNSLDLKL